MSEIGKIKTPTPDPLLSVKEVSQLLGVGVSTWWLWVKHGKAPQPIKLGPRTTRWRHSSIVTMIDQAGG